MTKTRGLKLNGLVGMVLLLSLLLSACGPNKTAVPSPTPAYDPGQAAKVDTLLRDLLFSYKSGGIQEARNYARERGLLDDQDNIRFALTLSNAQALPAVSDQLQKMGAEIYQTHENEVAVTIKITQLTDYIGTIEKRDFWQELAALREVREVRVLLGPALDYLTPPTPVADSAVNEGVKVIGADKWQAANFKGQGIKVGIIDGGFKNFRNTLGDLLPPAGQVLFRSYLVDKGEGKDLHGIAVAEIVHSLAPEASLLMAAIEDEIGFAQAVDWLLENRVQVIQVSLGWAGLFPGDGSAKMSQQLDRARQQGALPIVSVGNFARSHHAAMLNPDTKSLQRFGPNNQTSLKLTAESSNPWVALRWDENWEHPQTNLDLYLYDEAGQLIGSSRNEQGGNSPKPPTELVPFKAQTGQNFYVQVRMLGKAPPTPLRLHIFAYNATVEFSTADGSVATPGDARGVISVGAVDWHNDKVEDYSSRGPTQDGRAKPEIMGPSQIHSRAYGPDTIFLGTSASAPQVSGTAALLWSAGPNLTADQIAGYLARNAVKLGDPTALRDMSTGYGRVKLGSVEAARRGPVELLGALPAGPGFEDNFGANSTGLPDNVLGYYGKLPEGMSGYFIPVAEPGTLSWSAYLNRSYDEFRADFEAAPLQNDASICYGLAFWQQSPQSYYAFLVSGNYYALLRKVGSDWQPVINWTQDAALKARPRLSLEATATYIRLRAGETLLQSVALKEARPGGKLGFIAGRFDLAQPGPPSFAMFRNLSVVPLTSK